MPESNYRDEISLLELYDAVLARWKFIASVTFLISILGFSYVLISTPMYTSYVSVYPSLEESSMGSALGEIQGLASAIGISMDGAGPMTFYIPDIVNSRKLKKSVVHERWITDKHSAPVNLITYWEIDDPTKFTRRVKRFITQMFNKRKVDPQRRYTEKAMTELSELISIREEDSGLTTINVSMEEPELASQIANYIATYIKNYIRDEQGKQSKKYREFVEGRLSESKSDLANSEDELTMFRKMHPMALDTPELQLDRGRMTRNIEVNQEVYITLRQQLELARIEELRETSAINILDDAEPPVRPSSPKKLLIIVVSFLGGMFIGSLLTLIRYSVDKERKTV